MDGVSAVASVIAIVQAGGMLLKVGKAFHETFVSKDNDHRAEESSTQVTSIGEFIQKIELFQAVKILSSPQITPAPTIAARTASHATSTLSGQSTLVGSGNPENNLDDTLKQCKTQLQRLQGKVQKFLVPTGASKWKRIVSAVRQKLNEQEFLEIDATITKLLQQLTLYVSIAQFNLSQQSNDTNTARHDELLRKHQQIEQNLQDVTQKGVDHQSSILTELSKVLDSQMKLHDQVSAYEQSHQMIVSSFEKLVITPRLDRSLSGTTAATENEDLDDDELVVPIAPVLLKHPGFGFRGDRLAEPTIDRCILDRVDEWLGPKGQRRPVLCLQVAAHQDVAHDLCNRIVLEIANSGSKLLCYNGLPREGSPPAPGWYTITHAIWWLSGQLLIPVPHLDGNMPPHGYVPNIEAVCERIEKQHSQSVFIVCYLLTKSCQSKSDARLYDLLIERLVDVTKSSTTRMLMLLDDPHDVALKHMDSDAVVTYRDTGQEIMLSNWEPVIDGCDDNSSDEDEAAGSDALSA